MWNSRLSFAFLYIVAIENNNSSSKNKWTRKNLYLTGIRIGLHTLDVPTLKPLDIILVSFTKSCIWMKCFAFGWNIENRDVFETPFIPRTITDFSPFTILLVSKYFGFGSSLKR